MKTIVLATDFSKSGKPASDFAHQLAELLKARLVLLHVYHHPLPKSHNLFLFSVLGSNTQQLARQSDVPVLAIV